MNASTDALAGGTYVYVLTKVKGSGETDASDVLPVTVAYDQTYSVTLGFQAISTYTDGTTQLNLYRSAGLNSSFQLVTQITDVNETSFVDIDVSTDQTQQPPSVSTFDTNRKVTINWSAIGSYAVGATKLNIYVTQQSGVWGTSHLLASLDLTGTPPPMTLDYLGSETLDVGYPYETSQIPAMPPKLNLATEATGGFLLTADGDFAKHQAKNIVMHTASASPASPVNGQVYYDTSINNMRAYINGAWTNWGITPGTSYTHPAEETGGHLASNIRWVSGSASPSVNTILSRFVNTAGTTNNQITGISSTGGPFATVNWTSTTPGSILAITALTPISGYTTQWVEVIVTLQVIISGSAGFGGNFWIEKNGTQITPTSIATLSANTFGQYWPITLQTMTTITGSTQFTVPVSITGGTTTLTLNANTCAMWIKLLP